MGRAASDLLAALQHADSAFPSGGFAFSQGLEGLAGIAGRPDAAAVETFVATQARLRWATSDRVALVLAHRAGNDTARLVAIDREVEAATLPESLRTGSRRNGGAFLAAQARLGVRAAADYRALAMAGDAPGHVVVAQGLVWRALGIPVTDAAAMSGHAFVSGMLQAAVRLGLIGALDAQRSLARLRPPLAACVARPVPDDAVPEAYTPLADIAAMRQARQEVRLFAN